MLPVVDKPIEIVTAENANWWTFALLTFCELRRCRVLRNIPLYRGVAARLRPLPLPAIG